MYTVHTYIYTYTHTHTTPHLELLYIYMHIYYSIYVYITHTFKYIIYMHNVRAATTAMVELQVVAEAYAQKIKNKIRIACV